MINWRPAGKVMIVDIFSRHVPILNPGAAIGREDVVGTLERIRAKPAIQTQSGLIKARNLALSILIGGLCKGYNA